MARIALLLVVLVFAAASCGGDEDESAPAAAAETVEISAREFAFDPSDVTLDTAGTYTFRLSNEGEFPHALEIESDDFEEETEEIGPGETAELTVDLSDGEYVLYCPVDGHREKGMEGTLVVGGGGASGSGAGESSY